MNYEDSEPSEYQEIANKDFAEDVHIRQELRGVMHYAVFDGEKQVSEECGPMNDEYIIAFAEGYSKHKKRIHEKERS